MFIIILYNIVLLHMLLLVVTRVLPSFLRLSKWRCLRRRPDSVCFPSHPTRCVYGFLSVPVSVVPMFSCLLFCHKWIVYFNHCGVDFTR